MDRSFIAIALLASASVHGAEPSRNPFHPFVLGMSLDEARAAAPNLNWKETNVSRFSGKALTISADDAMAIGNLSHRIDIQRGYYGSAWLRLSHIENVNDAKACEALTVAVLADLEGRFGTFSAQPVSHLIRAGSGLQWQTQRTSGGGIIVTPSPGSASPPIYETEPHERIKVGKRSTIVFESFPDADAIADVTDVQTRSGYAEYARGKLKVRLDSSYEREAEGAGRCVIETAATLQGSPPANRTITLRREDVERHLTIGEKHHSFDGVVPPGSPRSVELRCTYIRLTQHLDCAHDDRTSSPATIAAHLRASSIKLDTAIADPDDPTPLTVKLTIDVAAADRKSLDFTNASRIPIGEIVWAHVPTKEESEAFRRTSNEPPIPVVCQIQADASLVCTTMSADGAPIAAEHWTDTQHAAVSLVRRYRPAPTLASGAPVAGAVFETTVDFRPH